MKPLPMLSSDLVDELDKTVFKGVPDVAVPERVMWMNFGMRSLVEGLKARKGFIPIPEKGDHVYSIEAYRQEPD